MKFSIGDLIYLKRTGEEGRITAMLGKDMLEVEVNGTAFPVYADEVEHPYLRWFTEKKSPPKRPAPEVLPVEKPAAREHRLARGIYLSFLPEYRADISDDVVERLKIFLLNELPGPVQFDYEVRSAAGERLFHHSGTLQPFQHLYLHHLSLEEAGAQPRYHWRLVGTANGTGESVRVEDVLRIRAARLHEHLHKALLNNEPTFAFRLLEDFVPGAPAPEAARAALPELRPAPAPAVQISLADVSPREIIDLHAGQLPGYSQDMRTDELLELQLRQLGYFLNRAIVHRLPRVVIIHGLGNGILKERVRQMLAGMPEISSFTSEWTGLYGYGATIAWL